MNPSTPTDAAEVQDWIVRRLAQTLSVPPEQIDIHEPIPNYGLESIEAMSLTSELCDRLGRPLSPTLWWDCPTIAQLVEHLFPATTVQA
jgi:acyl carrier protein